MQQPRGETDLHRVGLTALGIDRDLVRHQEARVETHSKLTDQGHVGVALLDRESERGGRGIGHAGGGAIIPHDRSFLRSSLSLREHSEATGFAH